MNIILTLLTILCFLNLSSAAAAGKGKPNFHEEPTHSPNTQVALIFDIETLAELESIPKVIKTLNENHIKATFFISDRITLSPENLQIIQQVPKDRNHEIGLLFIVDSQKIHSNANSAYPLRKEIVEATFKFNANVYAIRIRFANEQTGIDLKYIEQNGRFVIPEIKAEIQSNTEGTIILLHKPISAIDKLLGEIVQFGPITWLTVSEGYREFPEKWPDWRRNQIVH